MYTDTKYSQLKPRTVVSVDHTKPPDQQKIPLHNRYHPEIPTVATVKEGEFFRVECLDAVGGQIRNEDTVEDLQTLNQGIIHPLSGPIRVVDKDGVPAHPGDLLKVEICDLGPLDGHRWGFTCSTPGAGFLNDKFGYAKVIWDFEGINAVSRHLPGIKVPRLIHPGVLCVAPSQELLEIWNEREKRLLEEGRESFTLGKHLHGPLALLPSEDGALLGKIPKGTDKWKKIVSEAARTFPPRENGGNVDIKNISKGSNVYFPVFVEGANLSVGDMHYCEGDGEICVNGMEMAGFAEFKCTILRGGTEKYITPIGPSPLNVLPIFETGPVEPRFSEWLVFEGISVDENGKQHFLDATISFKQAVMNAINYLHKFGYSKEQLYLLLSAAPCEGRISGIVDVPNCCCTFAVPTAIFDQDVLPKSSGAGQPKIVKKTDCVKLAKL